MYNLTDYGSMLADVVRTDAHARALQAAVKPGCLVVEVGTGIGAFAVMAAKLGARRVIAIEPNDAIAVAIAIAKENGVADRIEFIHALAKDVVLAERADVLLADLRGALPVATTYLESMIDARDRMLKPAGTLIPTVDTLYAAVVHTPGRYRRLMPSLDFPGAEVDLTALRRFTTNIWGHARFDEGDLLTPPRPWAQIDYRVITDPNVGGHSTWTVQRDGTGHGLGVWFDATLAEGVTVSNAPGQPDTVWGMAFFPWSEPVGLEEGDTVSVSFKAHYTGRDHVWRWDTEVTSRTGATKARFRQSSFYGEPFVAAKLAKGAAATVARLSDEGRIERFVLDAMNGDASNEDIATRLRAEFPDKFPRDGSALARVAEVAQRFV